MLMREAKQEQYAQNCTLQILYALQMEKNPKLSLYMLLLHGLVFFFFPECYYSKISLFMDKQTYKTCKKLGDDDFRDNTLI